MHFTPGHHHTPCSNTTSSSTVIIAAAATSAARRNTDKGECTCCCTCGRLRYLVTFFGLLGCCLDYMLRFNISVAIVAMVNTKDTDDANTTSNVCPAAINATKDAQTTTGGGEYDWTSRQQGLVLGMFFWGYIITKMIGGRVAEIVGPRLTVGVTTGLCGLLTLATPSVASLSPYALAALRFLMGMLQGPLFPSVYSIMSRWALPGETATMVAMAYSGGSLGALMSLGLSGFVIDNLGWRWVFWGGGIITVVWVPFWLGIVRDSPSQHPRITRREQALLVAENKNKPRKKVPWSRIFRSRHIYLYMMMEFINVWAQGILLTEGPTFMTTQIGLDLKLSGTMGIVITTSAWVCCFAYGWFSDLFKRKEWLEVVNIRRLMQAIGLVFMIISSVGVVLAKCNATYVAAFLIIMSFAPSNALVTYVLGPIDIAPNYAGTLSGLTGLGTISGFLSPMFVSYFTSMDNGWTIVFFTNIGLYAVVSIIYMIGVSATEVEWNQYEEIEGDSYPKVERKK